MSREAIPTWFFVLVIVLQDDQFLLVQETKHGKTWYLPAGRVEPGELLTEAAERETLEESGLRVKIEGILRIDHTPLPDYTRVRVIFVASPIDDTPPKSRADEHTLQAAWYTLPEVKPLALRGIELIAMLEYVQAGATIYPLSLLSYETAPFKFRD